MISKIKRKKIDLVIDFEQFARVSTILSYLSNAKKRIGFNTKKQGRGMLYTTKVNYNNNQFNEQINERASKHATGKQAKKPPNRGTNG